MIVIPAIDLLGGAAVRLVRGVKDTATVYSREPWNLVREFAAGGAERVHVVDLDGAFEGAPQNRDAIEKIVEAATIPVQLGGGLRSLEAIEAALEAGVSFAVVGTAAVRDPAMVERACGAHPGRLIIAVDARDGKVAVEGWTETSEITALELSLRAESWGAAAILYTDIARDGASTGPNVQATAALAGALSIPVIASGGVSELGDLSALAGAHISMAIVGRALYDRRFTLQEAIAAC